MAGVAGVKHGFRRGLEARTKDPQQQARINLYANDAVTWPIVRGLRQQVA